MKCCVACFDDRGLQKRITFLSNEIGQCSYCHTKNVRLVEPSALAEHFGIVRGSYSPSDAGRPLLAWLKADWLLFSNQKSSDAERERLIAHILGDDKVAETKLVPIAISGSDRLVEWEKLRHELMYENRFFPNARIDTDRLQELISYLQFDPAELPAVWFRARIQDGDTPHAIDNMGAPPKRSASHGRANPPGIPYLYLGSLPLTAIAEVRPHPGDLVCVADFTVQSPLKFVDLRSPRTGISPFMLGDEREVALLRSDVGFLEKLGDELTRPVIPRGAAIDYIPSQYLCEFIKKCGYDGVVYRSSVSDGMNLALFDAAKAKAGTVKSVSIVRVAVDVADFVPRA